ncbi:MAG: serine hydrolase [Elusimicrobia bacterium]|nr:serine hydrolase [Elusimicrobiota bacterium]
MNRQLIAWLSCFMLVAARASGEESRPDAYEDAVKTARSEIWQDINTGKCGSATAAIMENGQVVYAEGFGMADREEGIPVDKDTIFNIGSVSKVYVAASIMLLVDDGKVSLDKPVADYLPEFKMADERYKKITVRMILNHTSGLPGTAWANSSGFKYFDRYQQDTIEALARAHLKHEPGAMAVYCNDGFTLAEMIVERVSGKKYIGFLNERILAPLGLKSTGLSIGELKGKSVAAYYDPESGKRHPPEALSVLGAGGLSATAEDLCLFADAFSNQNQIFTAKSLAEMTRAQPSAFWGKLRHPDTSFGLGWDMTELPRYKANGVKVMGKTGGTGNYSSMIFTVPDRRISVAVIESGAEGNAVKVALDVLDAVLVDKKLIQKEEHAVSAPMEPQKIPAEELKFGGYYSSGKLAQISFDKDKNAVTVYALQGEEKTPKLSLIYNGGYYYDKDGHKFYFASIDGKDYLAAYSPALQTDSIVMQRLDALKNPRSLKTDMDGKQWLRRNVYPFEGLYLAPPPVAKSFLYKDVPGYVDFGTIKMITSPDSATMPVGSMRDQTELSLFDQDGTTWARVSETIYSPADSAGALKLGRNPVKIGAHGYNEWLKTDADMVLGVTTRPDQGRVSVFLPDGSGKYDSALDDGEVFAPKGSFVEFAGRPDDLLAVTGRK